ncbi:hypothetical protein [Mesorhizobium sp. M0965]|uniref:hypothetical protein n=1 Tax=Mesorhizobium sp. M0965 TaxID=2957036 RepID=UPI00333C99E1
MDAIEKAIRNAFEKGNADDRAFRERVYRSAFAALDRALQANPNVTVEVAIKRRKAVQAKITEIESEFLPAVPDVAAPTDSLETAPAVEPPAETETEAEPVPSPDVVVDGPAQPPESDAPRSRVLPVVPDIMPDAPVAEVPVIDMGASAPTEADVETDDAEVTPDRDDRRARRRRLPLTAIFLGVTLLAAAGIGLYFANQTGVFKSATELDTAPPEVPPTVDGDDFTPDDTASPPKQGEEDQARDWINVFSPGDPTQVNAPSDAKADVVEDESGSFLRIRSGASGSAISFDVGQGVLERIAGKHATFDIIARSEEGQETQISVDCNFGELGDCGRKRYAVGRERNEYLFDVRLPDKRPGAAGTIAINSDFDKQGKSVDIYEIRVSVLP